MLDRLLPDDPALLYRAAFLCHPNPEASQERLPFFQTALRLVRARGPDRSAGGQHVRGQILSGLGESSEAIDCYRRALALSPHQTAWRFEYAALLVQAGRLAEGRDLLLSVLAEQPDHEQARKLLRRVHRELTASP
jgi:predicted Zn-dependent protease